MIYYTYEKETREKENKMDSFVWLIIGQLHNRPSSCRVQPSELRPPCDAVKRQKRIPHSICGWDPLVISKRKENEKLLA